MTGARGTRCGVALAVATLLAAATSPAEAGNVDGSVYLDADAAVVGRIDPAALFDLAQLVRSGGGAWGGAVVAASTASKLALGKDLLTARGWTAAGLDPKRPVWWQALTIDGEGARSAYADLAGAVDWTPTVLRHAGKVMWRSRLVIPVRSGARATALVKKVLGAVVELHPVSRSNSESVALVVGARPRKGAGVVAVLRRSDVTAIGWLDGVDAYVMVRRAPRHVVVDLVGSFGGVPIVWARDRRKLLGALSSLRRRRGGFHDHLTSGSATALAQSGVHVWLRSTGLRAALEALALTQKLRAVADELPQTRTGALASKALDPTCNALTELARRGQIRDAALTLTAAADHVDATLRWGLRHDHWLTQLVAAGPQPAPLAPGGAVASARAYVSSLASLGRLWKPEPLARGFRSGIRTIERCPGASVASLLLTGWPELAAAFVSDLGSTSEMARTIVASLAMPRVLVQLPSLDRSRAVFAVDAELAADVADEVRPLFDTIFGDRRTAGEQERWGRGPIVAFEHGTRVGFAMGDRSLSWLATVSGGGVPAPAGLLAAANVDVPGLIVPLSREVPWLAELAGLARARLGRARVELTVVDKGPGAPLLNAHARVALTATGASAP